MPAGQQVAGPGEGEHLGLLDLHPRHARISVHDLEMDLVARLVTVAGEPVQLADDRRRLPPFRLDQGGPEPGSAPEGDVPAAT